MSTSIDFAAEFGGQDAADAAWAHWRALKSAAQGIEVEGLPFPDLTYILRVDGEIATYEPSGPHNVDIDASGAYVSVDIGLSVCDREQLYDPQNNPIVLSLRRSVELLAGTKHTLLNGANLRPLASALDELCRRYLDRVGDAAPE